MYLETKGGNDIYLVGVTSDKHELGKDYLSGHASVAFKRNDAGSTDAYVQDGHKIREDLPLSPDQVWAGSAEIPALTSADVDAMPKATKTKVLSLCDVKTSQEAADKLNTSGRPRFLTAARMEILKEHNVSTKSGPKGRTSAAVDVSAFLS